MKKIIYSLLAFLSIFSLISCDSDTFTQVVTFDVPKEPNRLVVSCEYLNGADSIQVFVSSSWNSGSESPSKVSLNKCKVELLEGTNKVVEVPYKLDQFATSYDFTNNSTIIRSTQSYYAAKMTQKLVAGKTYTLRVASPGFETVEAQCKMPEAIAIKKTFTKKNGFKISNGFGGGTSTYNLVAFDFDDPIGENFYNVQLVQNFTDTFLNKKYVGIKGFYTNQKFTANPFEDEYHNDFFFTDDILQGQSFTLKMGIDDFTGSINIGENIFISTSSFLAGDYELRFHSMSKERFTFQNSAIKQADNDGNPFGEPIPLYTNFDKGFGLFALFDVSKATIKIK
jgi:hypothetical protein